MAKYAIAEDSPSQRASVDGKQLRGGDDPVALTKDQAKRLEESGVVLVETEKED